MAKARVEETQVGILGRDITQDYDLMQRNFRDRGWMETKSVIKSGIDSGAALEIGPGPGYLGLEWLKQTQGTSLTGLDISPDMKTLANKNAAEYGLSDRVEYILGTSLDLPFEDNRFDHIFSAGSLHEWAEPERVMSEISRVLKPGGRFFIGDLKRDSNPLIKAFMWLTVRPQAIRPGLISSLNAAYTKAELAEIMARTPLNDCRIKTDLFGLAITGRAA